MTGPFTDDERVVGEMIENAGFKKDDSGKPRLSLLPAVGLEEIAIVMQFSNFYLVYSINTEKQK